MQTFLDMVPECAAGCRIDAAVGPGKQQECCGLSHHWGAFTLIWKGGVITLKQQLHMQTHLYFDVGNASFLRATKLQHHSQADLTAHHKPGMLMVCKAGADGCWLVCRNTGYSSRLLAGDEVTEMCLFPISSCW